MFYSKQLGTFSNHRLLKDYTIAITAKSVNEIPQSDILISELEEMLNF